MTHDIGKEERVARTKSVAIPKKGEEAPEFYLPSAQGGQLRLSMRTVRGPVVVVFYRGVWSEEDVAYFKALAEKEDEINLAAGSVVGVSVAEPDEAREFVRATGVKSYMLYDYAKVTSREWGLLEKDKKHGEYSRPATFIVGTDHKVLHAWVDERPAPEELLARVSEITGLPKPAEETDGERPKKSARAAGDDAEKPERKKLSPEEREKRRAERKAAREAESAGRPEGAQRREAAPEDGGGSGKPGDVRSGQRKAQGPEDRAEGVRSETGGSSSERPESGGEKRPRGARKEPGGGTEGK